VVPNATEAQNPITLDQIQGGSLAIDVSGITNNGTSNITKATTSLAGTTAGTIDYVMPEVGTAKKFIAFANGYENDTTTAQTITFPTAFTNAPAVSTNTSGLTLSATATTLTITAPDATTTYTGVIIVEGI
jgi:hypothetical protein